MLTALSGVGRRVLEQPPHMRIVECVESLSAISAHADEAGGTQQTELMRCGGLGQAGTGGQIGHAAFAVAEPVEQRKARRVAEQFEEGRNLADGHGRGGADINFR
jgi:hypothetical protein